LRSTLADGERHTIPLRYAQRAADWCDYLESHAHRIYSMIVTREHAAASELGRRPKDGWRRDEGFFSPRDVYRNAWGRLATPSEVRAALPFLEDAGWIRERQSEDAKGRPRETYRINPRIYSGGKQ